MTTKDGSAAEKKIVTGKRQVFYRMDEQGRIVILKEIRRTLRIREADLSQTALTSSDLFLGGITEFARRFVEK